MTQVLTQEKARELLKELQYAKAQLGQLSIKDEYFKQALEKIPRWIACSERMPHESGQYVVMRGKEVTTMGYSVKEDEWDDESHWWCANYSGEHTIPDSDITHWMPLPEAPL